MYSHTLHACIKEELKEVPVKKWRRQNIHSYIRTPTPSPLLPLQAIKREPLKNDRVPFGIQQLGIDVTDTSVSRDVVLTAVSLAGAATSIILSRQKFCLSRQNYVRHDKTLVATSILLSRQKTCFVATKVCMSRQKFCRNKMMFVATKDVFCRAKNYTCGSSRQ